MPIKSNISLTTRTATTILMTALLSLSHTSSAQDEAENMVVDTPAVETLMTETPAITEITQPGPDALPGDTTSDAQTGRVSRAIFTTNIIDREPADNITSISKDNSQINFFTELNDLTGETVTHRWEYNGEVMAEVKFDVGGPRWRIYSVKSLQPEWTGMWTVVVTDSSGRVLNTSSIDVTLE